MTYFYYQSLTREFELIKERTTLFPDHQLSSSALKKLISSSLRTILNRYLPQNVRVGHGHIMNGKHLSDEMDLIFYRSGSRLWYQENQFVIANAKDVSGVASIFPKVEDLHQLSTFMAHLAHVSGKTFEELSHDPRSFFDSPGDKNQQQNIFTGMLVLDYEGQDTDQAILDELSSVSRKDSLRTIHYLTPGVDRFFAYQGNTQGWESYYFPESDHSGLTCFIGNILEHFSGSQASSFPQWLNEKPSPNGSTYPQSDLPERKNNMNGYHSHQDFPENNSQNDLNHLISVPSSESSVLVSEPIAKVEEFIEKPEEEEVQMEESVVEVEEIPEEEPEMETQTEAVFTPTIELAEVKSMDEQTETVDSDEITSQEGEVEKVEEVEDNIIEEVSELPEENQEEDQVEAEEKVETTGEVVEEDEINEPDEVKEEEKDTLQTEEMVVDESIEEETPEEVQTEQEEIVDSEEDIDTKSIDQEELLTEEETANSLDEEDQDEPEDQSAKSSPSLIIPVKKHVSNSVRSHKRAKKAPQKPNKEVVLAEGNTILHHAILNGDFDEFAGILEKNIHLIEDKNKNGDTPLHLAIENNLIDIAELLILHEADVNSRNYTYDAPLHAAVLIDSPEMTELLIQNGAEVEVRNNRAHTALHKASIHGCADAARVLIENHADINSRMEKDMLPIHLAAWYGQGEMIELLIQAGADLDGVNSDGNSSLHFAAFNGQVKVIKILINHDADPTIVNKSGETYLQGLNEGYSGEMIKVLE